MSKLRKTTLSHNGKNNMWELKDNGSSEVIKSFKTKADATTGGVLSKALGTEGGSVRIKKLDGTFEEERTFPGSADPRSSKG
ncbi:MAG: DUF2188 domain-containing protein [Chitinophagales bacterium]|nr:DUF2188 domain-containing protein [Chitinophagales bacterium]